MSEISEEKKKEVYELIEKQKKAKISWVATITQFSEEEIKNIAWDIGLIIEEDQIVLPTETKEGKIQAKIQEEKEKPVWQKALSERIFRYRKGETKRVNWDRIEKVTTALDFLDADLLIAGVEIGGVIAGIGKAIKRKVEVKAETYVCRLDGRITFTTIKSGQISLLRNKLVEEIRKGYKNKLHYLIPIKSYYELLDDPESDNPLKDIEHKKSIMSVCKIVDESINAFCNKIVNLSVETSNEENYIILLTTGKRANCLKDNLQLNKYSLFLSYRSIINQLYYEMTEQSKITEIIDFAYEHPFQQANLYEKNLQQLFEELVNKFKSQQLMENAGKIESIL